MTSKTIRATYVMPETELLIIMEEKVFLNSTTGNKGGSIDPLDEEDDDYPW